MFGRDELKALRGDNREARTHRVAMEEALEDCRREPRLEENKMECGQSSQRYNVIARIGTQWFGADIITYPGTLRAWACADGQSGSGNW